MTAFAGRLAGPGRIVEVALDTACWAASMLIAAFIGARMPWGRIDLGRLAWLLPIVMVSHLACGFGTGLYRTSYRVIRAKSSWILARSAGLTTTSPLLLWRWGLVPRSSSPFVMVGGGCIAVLLMAAVRYLWRRRAGDSVLVLDQIGSVEGIEVGRRKRVFDLVIGAPLTIVAIPFMAAAALVSAVSLRSWPFFVQERIGHLGTLRFVKIRTLPPHAPHYGLKTDEKVVATSRVLTAMRRTHIDELPQLFLVLTGKLTLVGPRPRMPDAHEPVPEHYHARRIAVPQGCTGLWQISPDRTGLPHHNPEYDFFYITHWSLRLDAWVLWRTTRRMLGVGGLVALCDIPRGVLGRQPIGADEVVGVAPGEVAVHSRYWPTEDGAEAAS